MRAKEKRALTIALIVILANVIIYMYVQYDPRPSGDILRQAAVIDHLGPPLPSEDLEKQLLGTQAIKPKQNHTFARRIKARTRQIKLKANSVADKFLFYSYLRSGGSKVAEILNLHFNDIFYLHHPLYNLDKVGPDYGLIEMTNRQSEKALKLLQDVYNCSLKQHKELHEPLLWKSHSVRNTYRKQCQLMQMEMPNCVELACKQRSLKAVFTLRLDFKFIYQLLKIYGKKIKIIMVIRDPRAVLSTRRQNKIGYKLNSLHLFKSEAEELCDNMAADLTLIDEINRKYEGAVKVLRYEHFLLHPYDVLAHMYNFLGLDVSKPQINNILNILKLNLPEDQRQQQAKTWQLELTLQESRAVDKGCKLKYEKLGYFPVPQNVNTHNKYFITWDQAKEKELHLQKTK